MGDGYPTPQLTRSAWSRALRSKGRLVCSQGACSVVGGSAPMLRCCPAPVSRTFRGTPHLYLGPSGVQVQIGQHLSTVFSFFDRFRAKVLPVEVRVGQYLSTVFPFFGQSCAKVLLDPDLFSEGARYR